MTGGPNRPVLVAYATKHGSTHEVAEVIADILRRQSVRAEVRPAAEVDDVTPYAGVVLGGSLYFGRWHKDALDFLRRHRSSLRAGPLAIYAMGPKTNAPEEVAASRAQLERALAKVPDARPDTVVVFGGVIDPSQLSFPLNRLPASDARDWQEILSWAAIIGVACAPPLPVETAS